MTYYGRRPAIINKYFYGRGQPYGCFWPCARAHTATATRLMLIGELWRPTHVKARVASMPASNVVFVTRFSAPEPAPHPPRAFRAPFAAHAARRARPRPRKPNQKLRRRERTANDRRRCLNTADSKAQRYARAAL